MARSAGAGQLSSTSAGAGKGTGARAAGQGQRLNSAPPPPTVDASTEKMIEKVVPIRDGVKHAGDALRRFGDVGQRWSLVGAGLGPSTDVRSATAGPDVLGPVVARAPAPGRSGTQDR